VPGLETYFPRCCSPSLVSALEEGSGAQLQGGPNIFGSHMDEMSRVTSPRVIRNDCLDAPFNTGAGAESQQLCARVGGALLDNARLFDQVRHRCDRFSYRIVQPTAR